MTHVHVNNNLLFKINRFSLHENTIERLHKINFEHLKSLLNMTDPLRAYCSVYNQIMDVKGNMAYVPCSLQIKSAKFFSLNIVPVYDIIYHFEQVFTRV